MRADPTGIRLEANRAKELDALRIGYVIDVVVKACRRSSAGRKSLLLRLASELQKVWLYSMSFTGNSGFKIVWQSCVARMTNISHERRRNQADDRDGVVARGRN